MQLRAAQSGIALLLPFLLYSQGPSDLPLKCSPWGTLVIHSDPKHVYRDKSNQLVVVHGKWKVTSDPKRNALPVVNSVQIECDRRAMVCREAIAVIFSDLDRGTPVLLTPEMLNLLTVYTQDYVVFDWAPTHVLARAKAPTADMEIRISLERETAEKQMQETAPGGTKPTPAAYKRWVLEQ